MRRIFLLLCAVMACAAPALAQNLGGTPLPIVVDTQCVTVPVGVNPSVTAQLTGTWTGTVTFRISGDGGAYVDALMVNETDGDTVTTTTANGMFAKANTGFAFLRACATAAMTGTAQVTMIAGRAGGGGGGGGGGGAAGEVEISQTGDDNAVDVLTLPAGNLTTTQADNLALTLDALNTTAFMYVHDGTNYDMLRVGTAGTAAAQVHTIQGIASMTPILATISDGAGAVNVIVDSSATITVSSDDQQAEDDNVAYALTPPVVIALNYCDNATNWERCNNQDVVFGTTTYTEATNSGPLVGAIRNDTLESLANTNNEAAPIQVDAIGSVWTRQLDPCSGVAKLYIPIDIVTATTTELTPSLAGASTHYYICSINLGTNAANNVALVDDNTDGCGSPTAGVMGGFGSAAEGWNLTAGSGLTQGNGNGSIGRTVTANAVLCLITSAATQLSGNIVVAAAP